MNSIQNKMKKTKISPDFIGDNPETMKEGTISPEPRKINNEDYARIPNVINCANTLSDKIEDNVWPEHIKVEDIKQAVKELKEEFGSTIANYKIDKIFGEKLI